MLLCLMMKRKETQSLFLNSAKWMQDVFLPIFYLITIFIVIINLYIVNNTTFELFSDILLQNAGSMN